MNVSQGFVTQESFSLVLGSARSASHADSPRFMPSTASPRTVPSMAMGGASEKGPACSGAELIHEQVLV